MTPAQLWALQWVLDNRYSARPQELGYTLQDRPGYREPSRYYREKGKVRRLKPQAAHLIGMAMLRRLEKQGLVHVGLWRPLGQSWSYYGAGLTAAGKAALA